MPGLIDQLAAETEGRRQREAEADAERAAKDAIAKREGYREEVAEARRVAMKAAQQMTGRVIFPARWDVEEGEGVTFNCTEVLEGRVAIVVVVNRGGFSSPVKGIVVSNVETGEARSWKGPMRHDLPVARQPISPGREWFRRQLVETGVI